MLHTFHSVWTPRPLHKVELTTIVELGFFLRHDWGQMFIQ